MRPLPVIPQAGASALLALYEIEPARGRNVLVYRIGESVAPVAATNANERSPSVSRDGRWIAYVSDASGRDEVYVARLDRAGDALQVTKAGASEPVWAREGLFYREGERMMLRALDRENLGEPQALFEGHFERDPGSNLASYDVDPQGRFFIMLKSALQPRELRVVKNWGTRAGSRPLRRLTVSQGVVRGLRRSESIFRFSAASRARAGRRAAR